MINQFPSNGGKTCDSELQQVRGCNYTKCKDEVDCGWGSWAEWSTCSRECGGGSRGRTRRIKTMPEHKGIPCIAGDSAEVEPCNTHRCGEMNYCYFGEWSVWSSCSASCGRGKKTRERGLELSSWAPDGDGDGEAGESKGDGILATGILAQLHGALFGSSQLSASGVPLAMSAEGADFTLSEGLSGASQLAVVFLAGAVCSFACMALLFALFRGLPSLLASSGSNVSSSSLAAMQEDGAAIELLERAGPADE